MELARHKVQKEKLWTERLPGLGTAVGGLGGGSPCGEHQQGATAESLRVSWVYMCMYVCVAGMCMHVAIHMWCGLYVLAHICMHVDTCDMCTGMHTCSFRHAAVCIWR